MEPTKSFGARHRYARITARKARLVADLIRGRPVNEALEVLQFEHKRAASYYAKLLRSAMANASQDEGVNVNRLVVSDCRADDGPMLQNRLRWRAGPQGRMMPFKKLTSHLTVRVTEVETGERPRRERKPRAAATKRARSSKPAQAATPAQAGAEA
jgi:large subunit ribosomal protein L22